MTLVFCASAAAAGASISCSRAGALPPADLVVTGGRVWTVDPARPEAEAIAVKGDRIVAVGSAAEIDRYRGPETSVIDARMRRVMPGFNDAHVHLMGGGANLDNADLRSAASPEEFARRIADRARVTPPGEWILGGDWDEQNWPGAPLPTRQLIDAVTPETPVFVSRYDGHMALANSVALRLAGVTSATPDLPGGTIVRDAKGDPTGILKDSVMGYVNKVIPPPSPDRRARTLRRALQHMASLGVTSVQDMNPEYEDIAVYEEFARRGELTSRIYAVPMETAWLEKAKGGRSPSIALPFLRIGAVKGYADGSLGSSTAYFFEPYTDAPGNSGLLSEEMQPLEGMRERLVQADKAGQQLCVHAIGDRAISIVLDLFTAVEAANGRRDRRLRIEHAQHVRPTDFDRFRSMGVIASVQPTHAIDDGRWAEGRIGPERAKTTYAFRTFLDRGVRLALGTDWPVAPLDPMLSLYAAVTRATLDGKRPDGWVPEQKIALVDAIRAYTIGAAFAEFQEKEKGSIEPGKLADIVILSDDILSIPPAAIRNARVDVTIAGGKVVFER